ncbi:MAG: hypothetical protein J5679_03070 [Alphaproteobacteria bacterium]|nr:hypothetical protein [Alphaproteobacteria bacterium]
MTELVPPEQPYNFGDNNGCLVQLLHLFGDIAIIAAMGLFVPSGQLRSSQKPKQKTESVKQDSIAAPCDTALVMTPNRRVFDNHTKQIIIDTQNNNLAHVYADNLVKSR